MAELPVSHTGQFHNGGLQILMLMWKIAAQSSLKLQLSMSCRRAIRRYLRTPFVNASLPDFVHVEVFGNYWFGCMRKGAYIEGGLHAWCTSPVTKSGASRIHFDWLRVLFGSENMEDLAIVTAIWGNGQLGNEGRQEALCVDMIF